MQYDEFLESTVRPMVNYPDDVRVDTKRDDMGILLTLSVHKEDMGQVIGRMGETVKSIRTLLRVVGMKNGARISFKVNEPE